MPQYNVDPKQWEQKEPVALNTLSAVNWMEAFNQIAAEAGWPRGLTNALARGGVKIADTDGVLSSHVAAYEVFQKDEEMQREIIQASLEGRLFIRDPKTMKVRQLQTEPDDMGGFQMDLSKPLDRAPWAPELILDKPEKPGLWTRFVAFFFRNSESAKIVREYEADLAAYNDQQARMKAKAEEPQQEVKQEEPVKEPEKEPVKEPEKEVVKEKPEPKMADMTPEKMLAQLRDYGKNWDEMRNTMHRLALFPKNEAEIRNAMLGCLRAVGAKTILDEMEKACKTNSITEEEYMQQNQSRIAEQMDGLKPYVHTLCAEGGRYHDMVKTMGNPKTALGNYKFMTDIQLFTAHGFNQYKQVVEAGKQQNGPENGGVVQVKSADDISLNQSAPGPKGLGN